jgi:O-antigen/teichoic acid export membrane protein
MRLSDLQTTSVDQDPGTIASVKASSFARKRTGIIGRMLHGTGAGMIAIGLGVVTNLLLLPLYLHRWSVAVYGEWMALYSVVNYLGALDLGVTTAAINAATMAYARKDWATFKRVQGTAWAAAIGFSGVGALIVIAVLAFTRVNHWLGLKSIGPHESQLVFAFLSVAMLAGVPGRQLNATYIALGEFAKYQWLYNAGAMLSCIAMAVALSLGARPFQLAVVVAATGLFTIAATYGLIYRRDKNLVPRLRDAKLATARSLAAPTAQFGIQIVATALTLQGPVVILSRALGGPAVALFTTTRTIANVVRGVLTVFRAPLRPEYAAAYAQANKVKLRSLFRIVMAIDTVMAVTLMAGFWSGGVWLIRFWSHSRIPPDPRLMHWLLASCLLEGFLWIMASAGSSANRLHGVSVGMMAYAVLTLVLTAALVKQFGPSAVPLSAIVAMITFFLPTSLRNAGRETEQPIRTLVIRVVMPFAGLTFLCAAISSAWPHLGIRQDWLAACISALTALVISTVGVSIVSLTGEDRKTFYYRLASAVR